MFTTAAACDVRSAGRTVFVRRIAARAPTARVVHENVEAAERRERLRRDSRHASARRDVAGDERRRRGGVIAARARSDHDVSPGIEKALRDGCADAARPSGDEGTAADEFFREIEIVGHEMFLCS
jgi:hypothetical protein